MVDSVRDDGTLHLIGLLSDGNVHSHIDHVEALVRDAHAHGARRTRLHCLLDGRDVNGQSAQLYVARIEAVFAERSKDIPIGRFGRSEEIANVVLFLCSDLASYINGNTLMVGGGTHVNGVPWRMDLPETLEEMG